ncbi:hypothetical protein QCA50_009502 [Cerrena zonata]|uniref:Cytochrome P450 n=1 Tax=Cerrena zonata TaxID=2478898 RepID=A0AAW0GAR1_9APHY
MGIITWSIIGGMVTVLLWRAVEFIVRPYLSPLRALPGPPSPSWLWGQTKQMALLGDEHLIEKWLEQYGNNITVTGVLNSNRLYTKDIAAVHHILMNATTIFQRSAISQTNINRVLGPGEQHKQQRRVMNPAFGPAQIRDLTEVFLEKSIELRDIWVSNMSKSDKPMRVEVLSWLCRTTLDIIGIAGFNYDFHSLKEGGKPNELNEAYKQLFSSQVTSFFPRLQLMIPILGYVPTAQSRRMAHAKAISRRIGMQLIQEKKEALKAHADAEKRGVKRDDLQGRDLLSLLIKANMATDVPESQRLTDDDVLAQIPTFLVAGHETTGTSVAWCLYSLCTNPRVQEKLREELLTVGTDMPSMDELNALPYLDMVMRETLRLHPAVTNSAKSAFQDDVIPVKEPYTDRFGNIRNEIRVAKGDAVIVPVQAVNQSTFLWGEDAKDFRPERWDDLPEAVKSIPGIYSHILTFIGGPRACIGYRFSLIEMKSLLFTLIRTFDFELAVPKEDIMKKRGLLLRPVVLSEPEVGNQLPLFVKLHEAA